MNDENFFRLLFYNFSTYKHMHFVVIVDILIKPKVWIKHSKQRGIFIILYEDVYRI